MAKCKICGSDLVKKKTKSGEVVLYCQDCKKIYRLKAKAEEVAKKVEEEEEEEEEETPVAPKKIPVKQAPVVEEEEEEEEEEEAPKKAPAKKAPVEEEEEEEEAPAPIPVVAAKEEPAPAPAPAPVVNNESLDSIAASLAEINDSLKGLLKIFNNIYKS